MQQDFRNLLSNIYRRLGFRRDLAPAQILMDTSVILDGRILQIGEAGWFLEQLLVPFTVLREIDNAVNSAEAVKSQRGKYGRQVIESLKSEKRVTLRYIAMMDSDKLSINNHLIRLARQLPAKLLTNDTELTKLARSQGIVVLNVNELAKAVKPVHFSDTTDGSGFIIDYHSHGS